MKISKLTNGLLVSLLLSASVVEADSDYPATNFQPKIVYQDSSYKHAESTPSASSSTGEVSVADSNYPAANFKPEVLFEDENYKHKAGSVKNAGAVKSVAVSDDAVQVAQGNTESSVEVDDSSMDLIIGLAILAIAGFVFYSKSAKKPIKLGNFCNPLIIAVSRCASMLSLTLPMDTINKAKVTS